MNKIKIFSTDFGNTFLQIICIYNQKKNKKRSISFGQCFSLIINENKTNCAKLLNPYKQKKSTFPFFHMIS